MRFATKNYQADNLFHNRADVLIAVGSTIHPGAVATTSDEQQNDDESTLTAIRRACRPLRNSPAPAAAGSASTFRAAVESSAGSSTKERSTKGGAYRNRSPPDPSKTTLENLPRALQKYNFSLAPVPPSYNPPPRETVRSVFLQNMTDPQPTIEVKKKSTVRGETSNVTRGSWTVKAAKPPVKEDREIPGPPADSSLTVTSSAKTFLSYTAASDTKFQGVDEEQKSFDSPVFTSLRWNISDEFPPPPPENSPPRPRSVDSPPLSPDSLDSPPPLRVYSAPRRVGSPPPLSPDSAPRQVGSPPVKSAPPTSPTTVEAVKFIFSQIPPATRPVQRDGNEEPILSNEEYLVDALENVPRNSKESTFLQADSSKDAHSADSGQRKFKLDPRHIIVDELDKHYGAITNDDTYPVNDDTDPACDDTDPACDDTDPACDDANRW